MATPVPGERVDEDYKNQEVMQINGRRDEEANLAHWTTHIAPPAHWLPCQSSRGGRT
jgi:hypothetical protein